ncbi:branched-chain-amino-acid aminotransferase, mitochondrial-like [Convolutriloba macropyga]|uniref:branched-chain-amino-acid aminotransferase, mitochondrial-like n=1 Tax=Convolutriloba macropyga TaxID=536237 RepID=UPI003F51D9DF
MKRVVSSLRSLWAGTDGAVLQPRTMSSLCATKIRFDLNLNPKAKPDSHEDLPFGSVFTDHMLNIEWDAETGFKEPVIGPFQNLSLHPAVSSLHYSLQLFEGMKAYRSVRTGKVNLFRPQKNIARLNSSAERIALPPVDVSHFLTSLSHLVSVDEDWVPHSRRASLYIRPTYISTQPTLGVGAPRKALLYVILSPVGPYFKSSYTSVRLLADPSYIRAWAGGTGNYKLGGNYGQTIGVQKLAEARDCQQVLWLYGPNHSITEVGAMNIFVRWTNSQGVEQLVTPPLDSLILPGVTRDSVLALARQWGEFEVVEQMITMAEIYQAALEGRLHEIFGAGTACVICPVSSILYQRAPDDKPIDIEVPCHQEDSLATRLYDRLTQIQYDEVDHEWSVAVDDIIAQSGTDSRLFSHDTDDVRGT